MSTGITVPNLDVEEVVDETLGDGASSETTSEQDGGEETRGKIKLPDLGDGGDNADDLAKELSAQNVTRENIKNLVTNNNNYAQFLDALKGNPRGFFDRLEKTDPAVANRLLHELTDVFLERNDTDESDEGQRRGSRSRGAASVDPQVTQLMARLDRIEAEKAQERSLRDYDTLKQSFNGRIKQYMDSKELESLTPRDKKAVTALLHKSLAEDAEANNRIRQGNFRDIPKHLQSVLDDWTTDTLADAEDEASARGKVAEGARRRIASAADNVGGVSRSDMQSTPGGDDIWEGAAQEMARDLRSAKQRASRKR